MISYIYDHKVALPVDFTLKDDFEDNESYTGQLKVFFMVCKQVCVPQEFMIELLAFDKDKKTHARNQAMLRLAERRLPHQGDVSGLAINFAVVSKDALVLAVRTSAGFADTDVFIDTDNAVMLTAPPVIELQEGSETEAMIKIKAPDSVEDLNAALIGKTIHVVLQNRNDVVKRDFSF